PAAGYRVQLGTGITDLAGNHMAAFSSNFRINSAPGGTVSPGDITPPIVSGVFPAPGSALASPPSGISATFSEPLDPSTIDAETFHLVASGGDGSFGDTNDRLVSIQSVQYNAATRQAMLLLGETLTEDVYRVQLLGGIKDLAGNALDGDRD